MTITAAWFLSLFNKLRYICILVLYDAIVACLQRFIALQMSLPDNFNRVSSTGRMIMLSDLFLLSSVSVDTRFVQVEVRVNLHQQW